MRREDGQSARRGLFLLRAGEALPILGAGFLWDHKVSLISTGCLLGSGGRVPKTRSLYDPEVGPGGTS